MRVYGFKRFFKKVASKITKNIPELSYEDFIAFHKEYYHPSNSYIILYGNCNMEETLAWLDKEYLSNFDKIEIDSALTVQQPFSGLTEKKVYYPINAEQGTENKTLMSYNIALEPNVSFTDITALEIITQVLLQSAGAPLERAILDEKQNWVPFNCRGIAEGLFVYKLYFSIFEGFYVKNKKELNDTLSEIRDRFGMTNHSLELYAHEKYVEKLLMITMVQISENDNLKVSLKLKPEVFESLSVEKLFVDSTKITTKFNFSYKGKSIIITLLKASLDKNYIYYIEELLEVIYRMKFHE